MRNIIGQTLVVGAILVVILLTHHRIGVQDEKIEALRAELGEVRATAEAAHDILCKDKLPEVSSGWYSFMTPGDPCVATKVNLILDYLKVEPRYAEPTASSWVLEKFQTSTITVDCTGGL